MKLKDLNGSCDTTILNEIGIGIGSSSRVVSRIAAATGGSSGGMSSDEKESFRDGQNTSEFLMQIKGDRRKIMDVVYNKVEAAFGREVLLKDKLLSARFIAQYTETALNAVSKSLKLGFLKSLFKKQEVTEAEVINKVAEEVIKHIKENVIKSV